VKPVFCRVPLLLDTTSPCPSWPRPGRFRLLIYTSHSSVKHRLVAVAAALAAFPLAAQTAFKAAPSTRASAEVTLTPVSEAGQPAPKGAKIRIDYGQPHVRGRLVEGALKADVDTVWRLGANGPTLLTSELDLDVGGIAVPKGTYALYARTSSKGPWTLIISRDLGATYAPGKDLGSVPLKTKVLATPFESLFVALVPAGDSPHGDLRIVWGTREFTTTWAVK
jgi:hypothetical protein